MMIFDVTKTERFRHETKLGEKVAGIQLRIRICTKCKQKRTTEGGKVIYGTSRFNPTRFYCRDCK